MLNRSTADEQEEESERTNKLPREHTLTPDQFHDALRLQREEQGNGRAAHRQIISPCSEVLLAARP